MKFSWWSSGIISHLIYLGFGVHTSWYSFEEFSLSPLGEPPFILPWNKNKNDNNLNQISTLTFSLWLRVAYKDKWKPHLQTSSYDKIRIENFYNILPPFFNSCIQRKWHMLHVIARKPFSGKKMLQLIQNMEKINMVHYYKTN